MRIPREVLLGACWKALLVVICLLPRGEHFASIYTLNLRDGCCLFFVLVISECLVEHCAMEFTRKLREGKVLMGGNSRYCILIRSYEKCLKDTGRGCRGNLKYHTLRTVVTRQQNTLNCTEILRGVDLNDGGGSWGAQCLFPYQRDRRSVDQRLCSLFGDPHLRTFDGQFETCKTVGAWPLVDNSYLGIQVTNDPVPSGSQSFATGITKVSEKIKLIILCNCLLLFQVTVIVKALSGCTGQKVYEATSQGLPGAFNDGTKGHPFLDLSVRSADFHVVIHLKYISAKLFIRRHGKYLSLTARLPEEVIREKSPSDTAQLCLSGCPSQERVAYKEYLASPRIMSERWNSLPPKMQRSEAVLFCRKSGAMDFYFDACVFDLMISGSLAFGEAARDALGDARRLYSPQKFFETNRTDLDIYDHLTARVAASDCLGILSSAITIISCLLALLL